MRAMGMRATRVLLLVAGSIVLGSCVDEDVVFDERPIYQQVAVEAGDFVGYADPSSDDKLTFCGACHGDYQAQWETTAHAEAWAGLQSSDHAEAFCEACHTVNSLGNVVVEPAPGEAVGGHAAMVDEEGRYLDVQCESCHGPGLEHVLGPADANVPLAPMEVGTDLSFGCGECHQGTHHPFVEEWSESAHGNVNVYPATAGADEPCGSCHTGEGALLRLGETDDYLEKDELLASSTEYAQITCAVCHDPHGSDFEGQLRFPVVVDAPEAHLCAQCHDRGAQPDSTGAQRVQPHSPETDLLAGSAGWFPPSSGLEPGVVEGPHGVDGNERLCASCHVVPYSAVDEATGETFFSAGHGFRAAPCVGPDGLPTGETDCALTTTARSFVGCVNGCHDSEDAALAALNDAIDRILPLATRLSELLSGVDPNGLAPGGPLSPLDSRLTVAEGAYFNLRLAHHGFPFNSRLGPSARRRAFAGTAVHNPDLIVSLLEASIAAMEAEYGGAGLVEPSASPSSTSR